MNNTQKRFLLFATALPLLFALILIPFGQHLSVNIFLMISSVIATRELAQMARGSGIRIPVTVVSISAAVLPLITYLINIKLLPAGSLLTALTIELMIILLIPIFRMTDTGFKGAIEAIGTSFLCLIYPGFLMTYIIRITAFTYAAHYMVMFMFLVYFNDSFAWFMGVFFGKNSKRNIFAVSPNKSRIGFFGGIAASLFVTILSWYFFPHIFDCSLWAMILLGIVAGFTTIFGDLVESTIKRSAGAKDSGSIIMGRGGLLDSMDSLLLTAPVFYFFLHFFAA